MSTELEVKPIFSNDLKSFLINNGYSRMQFDILRFMGRHPRASLSYFVIARAMGTGGSALAEALNILINNNIIVTEIDKNGLATYSLYGDASNSEDIYALAMLDWSEAMSLRNHLDEDIASDDQCGNCLINSI
ncbi:MAG: hypothetical protein JXA01_04890 [Dehalococcoidia bacterium]|nr:hypothetical protein [Dehalococcoidia bacterium]